MQTEAQNERLLDRGFIMNVLFLSLNDFNSFEDRTIYSDLLQAFIKAGHTVCCISPVERRTQLETKLLRFGKNRILRLKIGNIQKVNLIEKGISTLSIEPLFIRAIKTYFSDIKFDLVLYATPPITFANVVKYIKKRDGAQSYLMLKDIFPQNSVDLGMLSKTGIKGLIYKYFRAKEKKLYALSDHIGCMSPANCSYLLKHNPEIDPAIVEVCPNSIDVQDLSLTDVERREMREKYGVPLDKKVFVYGGNLGRPQDVPFIVRCLKACADLKNVYFVIAGSGTDRHILEQFVQKETPQHVKLMGHLPKDEYDRMIACCDVGLIFLDHRFTIPNFPSRLLSYMQAGLPVLACTDPNTDVGQVIEEGGFGWWCESNDPNAVANIISSIAVEDIILKGEQAKNFLKENYDVTIAYNTIKQVLENKTPTKGR